METQLLSPNLKYSYSIHCIQIVGSNEAEKFRVKTDYDRLRSRRATARWVRVYDYQR